MGFALLLCAIGVTLLVAAREYRRYKILRNGWVFFAIGTSGLINSRETALSITGSSQASQNGAKTTEKVKAA
jgi:hypothetical protein